MTRIRQSVVGMVFSHIVLTCSHGCIFFKGIVSICSDKTLTWPQMGKSVELYAQ